MRTSNRYIEAIHILLYITIFSDRGKPKSNQLAESVGCNEARIRSIMGDLKRAGLAGTEEGKNGYILLTEPEDISLWDIYVAAEDPEPESTFSLNNTPNNSCELGEVIHELVISYFQDASNNISMALSRTSIKDIADKFHQTRAGLPANPEPLIKKQKVYGNRRTKKLIRSIGELSQSFQSYDSTPRKYGTDDILHMREAHFIQAIGNNSLEMREIAKRLYVSQGAVSQIASRLEKKGLIERKRNAADSRIINCTLTPKAVDIYEYHEVFDNERLSSLTKYLNKFSDEEMDICFELIDSICFFFHGAFLED